MLTAAARGHGRVFESRITARSPVPCLAGSLSLTTAGSCCLCADSRCLLFRCLNSEHAVRPASGLPQLAWRIAGDAPVYGYWPHALAQFEPEMVPEMPLSRYIVFVFQRLAHLCSRLMLCLKALAKIAGILVNRQQLCRQKHVKAASVYQNAVRWRC